MGFRQYNLVIVCTLTVLATVQMTRAAGASDMLGAMRQKYESRLLKIEENCDNRLEALPRQYLKSLEVLEQQAQKKGDLEGLIAIRNEAKRFTKAEDVTTGDIVNDSDALNGLQVKFIKFRAGHVKTRNQNIVTLAGQYVNSLAELEKDLTRKGKIDEAMKSRDEKSRVKSSSKVTKAEFELADAKAADDELKDRSGGDTKKTKPTRRDAPKNKNSEKSGSSDGWANPGGPGVTIYRESEVPLGASGQFKRLTPLANSERGSLLKAVAAEILVSHDAFYRRDRSRHHSPQSILGMGRYVIRQTRHSLRCVLSCRSAGVEINKATLVIEHYIKPMKKNSKPFEKIQTETIKLPNLVAGSKITVDTRGAITENGGYNGKRYTMKYFGATISIFDEHGALIYQTISPSSLRAEPPQELPEVGRRESRIISQHPRQQQHQQRQPDQDRQENRDQPKQNGAQQSDGGGNRERLQSAVEKLIEDRLEDGDED